MRPRPRPATADERLPFDYAAAFELTGVPGNVVPAVINIGPEGVFVAVAVGYGFEEERGRPLDLDLAPDPPGALALKDVTLSQVSAGALIDGFRVNPRLASLAFDRIVSGARGLPRSVLSGRSIPRYLLATPAVGAGGERSDERFFERLKPPGKISFLFSLLDSDAGREFQDEPLHSLASLGASDGARPFRLLAQPLSFLPRSTVRLQVIEQSDGLRGTLFIVLFGYTVLTGSVCPEGFVRSIRVRPDPARSAGAAPGRIVPFDYVAAFALAGRPGARHMDEVTVHTDGLYVATHVGYGLEPGKRGVRLTVPDGTGKAVALGSLPLAAFSPDDLLAGVRVRPEYRSIAFESGGVLATVPAGIAEEIFEVVNGAEDLSFRYSVFDAAHGVELQNQPIHNVAGLGIANGRRPFRRLARPLVLKPRSALRIEIEERAGRGRLYIVLQGYKKLGAAWTGGVR
jgi:hypothetical protein